MATREFSANDSVEVWRHLNEIVGMIDELGNQGVTARYWTGTLSASKDTTDGNHTSLKMNSQTAANQLAPTWDGDAFGLPAGVYRIDAQVTFDDNPGGYRQMNLSKNAGVTTYNSATTPPNVIRGVRTAASTFTASVQLTKIVRMVATDRLLLTARQTAITPLAVSSGQSLSELVIERIGD